MKQQQLKEIKKVFGNRKNYYRFMAHHNFNALLFYMDKYKHIPIHLTDKQKAEVFSWLSSRDISLKS